MKAFWGYLDVALFVGLVIPSLAAGLLLASILRHAGMGQPFQLLIAQLILYIGTVAGLALIFRVRYGRQFWRSLGWRFPFRGMLACLLGGPVMAILLGLVAYLIKTPVIKLPFDQMLGDKATTAVFAIFVVAAGPLWEELIFRGFLMPVLTRSLGVAVGIVLTGVLFGSLHAAEYQFSWRHVLLISIVGCILGWVRYAADSTAASTFLHATFNLTQLAGFFAQSKTTW